MISHRLASAIEMKSTIGSPARATDFLRREAETEELWFRATRGHVLMLAPRRVGKTSLLYHMRDQPRDGWRCLFISVEALETEAQFVTRLLTALYEAHPKGAWMSRFGPLQNALRNIDKLDLGPVKLRLANEVGDNWQEVGETALRAMKELQGNTLVLVDEFPIFVRRLLAGSDREPRTRLFLDWFREMRNALGIGDERLHFVLSGSLGLDAVVRSVGMSATINDLAVFRLSPLDGDHADRLLVKLAEGEGLNLSVDLRRKIRAHIDWPIPFHLQLLFAELFSLVKFQKKELNEELVDEAYASLLSPENRKHFEHWVERLEEPLLTPEERDLEEALLWAAARDPNGLDESSALQIRKQIAPDISEEIILASLAHDGYLIQDGKHWRFASSLLRDWWNKWKKRKNKGKTSAS